MSGFDTEQLRRLVPFSDELGIRLVAAEPAAVRLELDWQARLCTAGGVLHGGALMSLADTAGAVSAVLNLPDGATGTTTVDSTTNLLAAVREGTVSALATPLHAGRTLIVVETELRDRRGKLVAKTTQTQAVLRPPPASG
ncbi:MAG TPA: PaaI family thioesterase [Mycobacteriales bacterium]|nr:PaaI family thioesterase [Mycobacteriales bacterium]